MITVYSPRPPHRCGPGQRGTWPGHDHELPGTVLQCEECGRTWVARMADPRSGLVVRVWEREGWWARWRRERRNAKNAPASHEG